MTEELWEHTAKRETLLCHAAWPQPVFGDDEAAAEINWLVDLVTGLRSVRAEMNVPASAIAPLAIVGADQTTRARIERHEAAIGRLARVKDISHADEAPKGSAQVVVSEAVFCVPLGDLIDLKAERQRLEKAHGKALKELERLSSKLGNEKFLANARPEIVEAERQKLSEARELAEKLAIALDQIRDAG